MFGFVAADAPGTEPSPGLFISSYSIHPTPVVPWGEDLRMLYGLKRCARIV